MDSVLTLKSSKELSAPCLTDKRCESHTCLCIHHFYKIMITSWKTQESSTVCLMMFDANCVFLSVGSCLNLHHRHLHLSVHHSHHHHHSLAGECDHHHHHHSCQVDVTERLKSYGAHALLFLNIRRYHHHHQHHDHHDHPNNSFVTATVGVRDHGRQKLE